MICISVCATTQRDARRNIRRAMKYGDILELRMDAIDDGNLDNLMRFMRGIAPQKACLVTYRNTKPGVGHAGGDHAMRFADTERRWEMLRQAVRLGADYVDVELEDPDERIADLRGLIRQFGNRTKLICSHHEYRKTPSLKTLKEIYHVCRDKGGDVIKIVPFARKITDNIRIFQFLAWCAKREEKDVVAFCMGEAGRLSRVAAPLFGAAFTFAALDDRSAAAPGQIPAGKMIPIMRMLEKGLETGSNCKR